MRDRVMKWGPVIVCAAVTVDAVVHLALRPGAGWAASAAWCAMCVAVSSWAAR